jgi:hypothetical protein
MPFGVVVDALDDHVEARSPGLAVRLGPDTCALLDTVLPSLRAAAPGPGRPASQAGLRPGPDRPVPDLPRDAAAAGGPGHPARPGADPR